MGSHPHSLVIESDLPPVGTLDEIRRSRQKFPRGNRGFCVVLPFRSSGRSPDTFRGRTPASASLPGAGGPTFKDAA